MVLAKLSVGKEEIEWSRKERFDMFVASDEILYLEASKRWETRFLVKHEQLQELNSIAQ